MEENPTVSFKLNNSNPDEFKRNNSSFDEVKLFNSTSPDELKLNNPSVDEFKLNNSSPDEFELNKYAPVSPDEILRFNICGAIYEILESTLQILPKKPLADPEWRRKYWIESRGEHYLDRNRACFEAILTYYQTKRQGDGILEKPEQVHEKIFLQELQFYGLGNRRSTVPRILPERNFQRRVWELFEYPDTSKYAKALAVLSCSVVVLSIVLFCVETLPQFTDTSGTSAHTAFFIIEAVCIGWFTFEYLVRLLTAPCKIEFLKGTLNIIDLVAILPFFISFALTDSNVSSLAILRALRLVRVFRIFKLSRYSKSLQILGMTMKASTAELGILVFFIGVGVILFSSAIYYAEMDVNGEQFKSIPHAFAWSVGTMTTVGYEGMSPITLGGNIIGILGAFTGILCIALPVPVIVANFEYFYNGGDELVDLDTDIDIEKPSKADMLKNFFKNLRSRKTRKSMRRSVRRNNNHGPEEMV